MWIALVLLSLSSLCGGMIRDIFFQVQENCPLGTIVGNIKVSAELFPFKFVELSLENGDQFEDLSRTQRASVRDLFRIDPRNGDLVSASTIDRESLCSSSFLRANMNCSLLVVVSVNKLAWINVNVFVTDQNDNPPKFRRMNVTIRVSEISKIHSTIQLEEASDLDSEEFGPLDYSLRSLDGVLDVFKIQKEPLKLVLVRELDFETLDRIRLVLVACDSGHPPLCGNQTLQVEVINENDEAPLFGRSNYTAILNEDAPPGQVVLQPRAHDRDSGEYGRVRYSLSSGHEEAKAFLRMDPESGDIVLTNRFPNPTKLKFSVEARDTAPNPLVGRAWVFLHVVDVNDNSPEVQVTPLSPVLMVPGKRDVNHTSLEVVENIGVPLTLALVSVSDADQGENSRCTCHIRSTSSTPPGSSQLLQGSSQLLPGSSLSSPGYSRPITDSIQLIHVNEISERNIFRLVATRVFDAEERTLERVAILCTDHGEPQNSVMHEVEIWVRDQNEYPPSFDLTLYEIEIPENVSVGTPVQRIRVFDRDVLQSMTLEISPPGSSYFEINGSGVVVTKSIFDFEKMKKLEFFVIAVDQGPVSFTSSARVSVLVLDINDNAPEFEPNSSNFQVFENMQGTYKVGRVRAFDRDSSQNGQITFFLLNESGSDPVPWRDTMDSRNMFFIDRTSGEIHSNVSLDFERCTLYVLQVRVQDSGTPVLSNEQTLYVHVRDRNDNGPQWQYPNKFDHVLNISTSNIRDSVLTRVRAVDLDGDSFNKIHYSLQNHKDLLTIDRVTGVISLQTKIQGSKTLDVRINAQDAQSKEKRVTQTLTIHFQNDQTTSFLTISSFSLTFPVLTSIIGISSLISVVLIIILFFFCCRKHKMCGICAKPAERVDSKAPKMPHNLAKVVDIPLDLVTDNDAGCNNSIVEDSVKLLFGGIHSSSNNGHQDRKSDYDGFASSKKEKMSTQRNSTPNECDYYGLINVHSPYNSPKEFCALHSSSDEESSRYLEHIDLSKSESLQMFQTSDSTDCMINTYGMVVKCGCGSSSNYLVPRDPCRDKRITTPFIFDGSAWIPAESVPTEAHVVQIPGEASMPLKSIMKKTPPPYDRDSAICDEVRAQEKLYQCKRSQV